MIVNVEVDIARPRHQVFDLMADARNELEAVGLMVATRLDANGPPAGSPPSW